MRRKLIKVGIAFGVLAVIVYFSLFIASFFMHGIVI
jgi:hypothetical protein